MGYKYNFNSVEDVYSFIGGKLERSNKKIRTYLIILPYLFYFILLSLYSNFL